MKKFLAVVLLCLPVFGQAVYSGAGYSSGAAISSAASSGAPLIYSARTDLCVHGYPEAGCVNGTTTGQAGSAMSFLGADTDPVPFQQLSSGSANMNNCFTDPDFGTYSCFVTDQSFTTATADWTMGSDGGYNAFNKDGTFLSVVNSGSVTYLVDAAPSRFHAHTCAPSPSSAQCFVQSQIHGGVLNGNPAHDSVLIDNDAAGAFSQEPNTLYETTKDKITRLTITQPKDGNSTPTGLDTVTRTLVVDFTSDSPVPCKVMPTDYKQTWHSGGGKFGIAEGGGGSYQTRDWNTGGTGLVTTETFILPVNNNPGGANGNWMFQASAGQTSGTEPNWAASCATKGSTCTDGAATWTNIGNISGQGPGFDVIEYDPAAGCSRINTRTGMISRGTGNPDPAGHMQTDDWLTCDRLGNAATPGAGTRPCPLAEPFGLHAGGGGSQDFTTLGASGAGSANPYFPGVGACVDSGMHFQGAWSAATSYAFKDFVYDRTDPGHNWWNVKTSGGVGPSGTAPHLDSTNWQNGNNLCYGYIHEKHTLNVRPLIGVSPPAGVNGGGFSTDGHNIAGSVCTYRGGKMFCHYYGKPVCDDATAPCLYEGAANPGYQMDATASCNDSHPSYNNKGTLDREPAFFPHADVPAWPTSYTCSTYNEITALAMDLSQTVWRFGHNWNTGSNQGFGAEYAIGVISQQGDMLAYTSDFQNSRGDTSTGATTCAHKLRGMYPPSGGKTVTYLDTIFPLGGTNDGKKIFQAAGCPGNGGTTTCTEASNQPNWDSVCPNAGDYCTSDKTATGTILDNNVLWLNLGPNTCRSDVAVMDVLSAHPAP